MVRRKQLWADENFINTLEKIKAQRILKGLPPSSIPDLTKELIECPSFQKVVNELVDEIGGVDIKIRFDKKRIW